MDTHYNPDFPPVIDFTPGMTWTAIERAAIEKVLAEHGGNVFRAADALRISPRTIQRRLRHWAKLDAHRSPNCR